jgi:hypothetical protein
MFNIWPLTGPFSFRSGVRVSQEKIEPTFSTSQLGRPNGLARLNPGTDVMIFQIFSPKKSAKKCAFLTQDKAKLFKNFIITLVFEKNAEIFFAENCQKSQKIAIITSTPSFCPDV